MATYSERLYYEHLHPDFVEWWWYRRVDIFRPQGMIDGSIYDYEDFRDYVDSVYLLGVRFLEAVRVQIGDEAFFAFLQDYAQLGSDSMLSQDDFFRILTEYSNENISIIASEYFSSSP
jgi:aminopeptidase N